MIALLLSLSCAGASKGEDGTSLTDGGTTTDGGAPTDGGGTTPTELLEVDVLIIGSGPAGLAAAWEADQAGASVLVVERDETLGGAGHYARHLMGVGTRFQEESGVVDDPDQLIMEWPSISNGGDASDPWVQALANDSADVLHWLVDELGGTFEGMKNDNSAGSTQRVHAIGYGTYGAVEGLVVAVGHLAWTSSEATALRYDPKDPSRVAGAFVLDLATGEEQEIVARSTIIATGGFARDFERVVDARPELAGALLTYEAKPSSDGGGHHLLEEAGADFQNMENHGLYLNGTFDPREGINEEGVLMDMLQLSIIVDLDGQRVGDESKGLHFSQVALMGDAPDKRLFAVMAENDFDAMTLTAMADSFGLGDGTTLEPADLINLGTARRAGDIEGIRTLTDIDADGLQSTLTHYDQIVASGVDSDFGKQSSALRTILYPIIIVELAAGSAKSFGGARLDEQARVLDTNGEVIPGLYAAGEVAGMLGTPATGQGFGGSVTACYLTGRVAGRSAAAAE